MTLALGMLENRILSCFREAKTVLSGGMCQPRMACVYPTYHCNHSCQGCDYGTLNEVRKPPTMSRGQFMRVLEQFAGAGALSWEACGGGEPTLHPDLPEMIGYGASLGLRFGLLTNGTMLHQEDLVRQIMAHAAYVRVSLESATAATFDAYKRPKHAGVGFARVRENIQALVQRRREAGSGPLISMKFSVDRHNCQDIDAAFGLARALGVDSLQFKAIRNVPSELPQGDLDALQAKINAAWVEGTGGVRIMGSLRKSVPDGPCFLCPLVPTVAPTGQVFMCCYYRHRPDRHEIGNLFEQDLADFWGSPGHMAKMAAIRVDECAVYDCRYHHHNRAMRNLADLQLEFA